MQLAKCRIYRAITRARKVLALVNEPVKNGLLHSTMVDTTYEDDEDLRREESAKIRVLDLKDIEDSRGSSVGNKRKFTEVSGQATDMASSSETLTDEGSSNFSSSSSVNSDGLSKIVRRKYHDGMK